MKPIITIAIALLVWAGNTGLYAGNNTLLPDEYSDILKKALQPEKGKLVRGVNIGMTVDQVRNIESARLLQDTAKGYITFTFDFSSALTEFADVKYYFNQSTKKVTGIAFDFYLDTKDRSDILLAEFTKHYTKNFGASKKGIVGDKAWSFDHTDAAGIKTMVDVELTDLSAGNLGALGIDYYGYSSSSTSTTSDEEESDPSTWEPLDNNLPPMDFNQVVEDVLQVSKKSPFRKALWDMTIDDVKKNEPDDKIASENDESIKYRFYISSSETEYVNVIYYFDETGKCTGWGAQLFLGSYDRSEKLLTAFKNYYNQEYESVDPILGDYSWTLTGKNTDKKDVKIDIELQDMSKSGDYGFNIDYYKSVY